MAIDVVVETTIDRPAEQVADYAGDPSNAPSWYENIDSVEWTTPPPMRLGSKLLFTARFLGRRLQYIYEIVELTQGRRLVMRTAEGPFPMETTYTWEPVGDGRTRMTLRNRGKPAGFWTVTGPIMAWAVRRSTGRDLKKLKKYLESS